MRPQEDRAFEDPHRPIDLRDAAEVAYLMDRLGATPAELAEAVNTVGPNRTAVAIFLGESGAL